MLKLGTTLLHKPIFPAVFFSKQRGERGAHGSHVPLGARGQCFRENIVDKTD